jgi:hypothetical protein
MTRLDRYIEPTLKAGFALALAVVLAVALYPLTIESAGNGDKVQHFAAFYALTLLGAAAYSSRKALIWLIVVLSAYGAMIEVLQPLPLFGRDRDLLDWVADNIGIAVAVLPMLIAQWRGRRAPQ